ncbi:hypothetical protein C8R44DRAFT_872154 [Mycena epipterygia]|nr:hypothetical protein C8R44DRAFT_872154 [Mycena epipterygia]
MAPGQTPKVKAATTNTPSRATRDRRAKDAQVKTERGQSAVPDLPKLVVKKLKGDAPPSEVPSSHAIDDEEHVLFFNTYNEDAEYGSEIYACNLKRMTWKNITKSIKHLPFPLGSPECAEQLPSRFGGAMAFYRSRASAQRILFIFGGQIDGLSQDNFGQISNELIAVDIDNSKWWVVDVAGGPVTARVQSQLVVVDDQLFIFGGKTCVDGQFQSTESYCIASLQNHQWTWEVRDTPYPSHVPALGFCCDSSIVQDGERQKILLIAGCTDSEEEVKLLPPSFILFDIGLRTFTPQVGDSGTFPGTVSWYHPYNLPGSLKSDSSSTSVVICTFQNDMPQQPELYVYSVGPQAGCNALGMRKRIAAAKRNFELFAVVGSGMYLLGWTEDKWDLVAEIPRGWICG